MFEYHISKKSLFFMIQSILSIFDSTKTWKIKCNKELIDIHFYSYNRLAISVGSFWINETGKVKNSLQ
jgi:surface polysaccharide O-acyltransferase-like enzyme